MVINRQHLHNLVDMVENADIETIYKVLIRFIPEDMVTPDEAEAIEIGRCELERGETVNYNDIDWS